LKICNALKMKNSIVWKFLIDYSMMEELSLEEELLIFKSYIDSHPHCDFNKALKLLKNCSYSWRDNEFIQNYIREKIGTRELMVESSQYANWAYRSLEHKYVWLVDCYRLRVDDDYVWGGCHLHGIYDPNPEHVTPKNVAKDFMIFCDLAAKKGFIPLMWDWSHFFDIASEKICCAQEKSDIKEKWGFSIPSFLRIIADKIYGGRPGSFESKHDEAWKKFNIKEEETFKDVGGIDNWRLLVRKLECGRCPNFYLRQYV